MLFSPFPLTNFFFITEYQVFFSFGPFKYQTNATNNLATIPRIEFWIRILVS